jgi:glycyl-tRNA synthetase
LKRHIRDAWWKAVVRERDDVVGLDAAIIMHPRVWEASGHVGGFSDPMQSCRRCRRMFRADQVAEQLRESAWMKSLADAAAGANDGAVVWDAERAFRWLERKGGALAPGLVARLGEAGGGTPKIEHMRLLLEGWDRAAENRPCPACGGELTPPRDFNLMFRTFIGALEDSSSQTYLRPETAQGIFVNYLNVLDTSRVKVPFGIAQVGKAFRNEINPRNYTFRSREFEQMELEFFVPPGSDAEWHAYWVDERMKWYRSIGLPEGRLSRYVYAANELAHYASACTDVMYRFPFGEQELEGIAARGDFDLRRHQEFSGKNMEYFDAEKNQRYIPHVIEPSAGVDRVALAALCEAYREEWVPQQDGGEPRIAEPGRPPPAGFEPRTVLRFAPVLAPIKIAVFPLLKNRPELVEKSRAVFEPLRRRWPAFWDQTGAIGRRYRRQDEIGTPWCITIDFQTLEDDTVTVRDRDNMRQERVPIADLADRLAAALDEG